ncbi:MAG: TonB-dependent receptor plug domain-containing protein [Luteolibacter sp.]
MTNKYTPQRGLISCALALCPALIPGLAIGQTEAQPENTLDPLVVSALRVPRPASSTTSSVTTLDPEELEKIGIDRLQDALNFSPGVISTSTAGQNGAIGSLFIRGTTTAYSQVVIDGVRISDSNTPLGNILGASRVHDIGRIEVLRGPQGAAYGGESVGGVLFLETPRGTGDPSGRLSVEAGSFDSLSTYGSYQGEAGPLSYYLSGGYEETDNDTPTQDFHQGSSAMRIEATLSPVWTLGTTFRHADSTYQNEGNSIDHLDSALATMYAVGRISDRWTSRFNAGYQQEFYDSDSPDFGNFGTDLRNLTFSTDQEIALSDCLDLVVGGYFSRSDFENTIGVDERRDRYGFHAAAEWEIQPHWVTTVAGRWEDYDEFGDEFTWRVGSVYTIESTKTSIRGGIGRSFRSPSFLDLFGSSFGQGNPNLEAESAIGWDIGVAQELAPGHRAEVTVFQNRIEDAIQSFPTPPQNISGTSTPQGIELALDGVFESANLHYRLAYTYLNRSLADQPRNSATTDLTWKPNEKFQIGIGATYLSGHSFGGDDLKAYTLVRLHSSYQLTENVRLHARLENALDEEYLLSNFFGAKTPGAGTGLYAGLTYEW